MPIEVLEGTPVSAGSKSSKIEEAAISSAAGRLPWQPSYS